MSEEMGKLKPCNETQRLCLILKNAYELAFDVAIRLGISDAKEAQQEAWMKVAGSVKLMIESTRSSQLEADKLFTENRELKKDKKDLMAHLDSLRSSQLEEICKTESYNIILTTFASLGKTDPDEETLHIYKRCAESLAKRFGTRKVELGEIKDCLKRVYDLRDLTGIERGQIADAIKTMYEGEEIK